MSRHGLPVTIVRACLRDGQGGSPTAVLDEAPLSDDERRRVPVQMGTSHAVFVSVHDSRRGGPVVSLRFFTAEGELPACGHGTVAALAFLAERAGGQEYRATIHATGRPNVKLFNSLVHILTETSWHAGHADMLREQLDGSSGTAAQCAAPQGDAAESHAVD
jgi:predicted PhzF superfamily epimerase YddE/YHI9